MCNKAQITDVTLYFHQTANSGFFDPLRPDNVPEGQDHVTKAKWDEIEMKAGDDGKYTAVIPLAKDGGAHVAFITQARDFAGKTPGFSSSLMQWIEKPIEEKE